MRFPLGLSGRQERDFLDYFNAGLRARRAFSGGNGETLDDGSYSLVLTGPFPVGPDSVSTTWKFLWSAEDALPHMDVEADEASTADHESWESSIREFISEVNRAARAKRSVPHFRREAFHYIGYNLNGEFWLPGFRLAPADPGDNIRLDRMVFGEERVLHIDQSVEAIDDVHAIQLGEEKAARIAARLSLLLSVGLYRAPRESRWTLFSDAPGGPLRTERRALGFLDPLPTGSMPARGKACAAGEFVGSISRPLGCTSTILRVPEEVPAILAGVDTARVRDREAFDACARLYQVCRAVSGMFPSVSLAYMVAAADAIPTRTADYSGHFKDFMRVNSRAFPRRDAMLDQLWRPVRSGHFHGGRFALGGHESSWPDITDPQSLRRVELQADAHTLLREAIITWTLQTFVAGAPSIPGAGNT